MERIKEGNAVVKAILKFISKRPYALKTGVGNFVQAKERKKRGNNNNNNNKKRVENWILK